MSEQQEITAAAAAGAAAAVSEVQDQQAQQEVAELAATAATVAAGEATEASQAAAEASQTASVAVDMAASAQAAAETTAIGLTDVYDRLGRVETAQEEFVGEARAFFASLKARQEAEPAVQQVEVTHNAPKAEHTAQANSQQEATNTGSGGGASQTGNPRSRKRFGR